MPKIELNASGMLALAGLIGAVYVVNKLSGAVTNAVDSAIDTVVKPVAEFAGDVVQSTPVKIATTTYNKSVSADNGAIAFFGDLMTLPLNIGIEAYNYLVPPVNAPTSEEIDKMKAAAESKMTFSDVSSGNNIFPQYGAPISSNNVAPGSFSAGVESYYP